MIERWQVEQLTGILVAPPASSITLFTKILAFLHKWMSFHTTNSIFLNLYIYIYIYMYINERSTHTLAFHLLNRVRGSTNWYRPLSVDFRTICNIVFIKHYFKTTTKQIRWQWGSRPGATWMRAEDSDCNLLIISPCLPITMQITNS